jgi:hypothetical protein
MAGESYLGHKSGRRRPVGAGRRAARVSVSPRTAESLAPGRPGSEQGGWLDRPRSKLVVARDLRQPRPRQHNTALKVLAFELRP